MNHAYVNKIAFGPDIGQIASVYADNALIPHTTAKLLNIGVVYYHPPISQSQKIGYGPPALNDSWNNLSENQWDAMGISDWDGFTT